MTGRQKEPSLDVEMCRHGDGGGYGHVSMVTENINITEAFDGKTHIKHTHTHQLRPHTLIWTSIPVRTLSDVNSPDVCYNNAAS